MPKNLEEVTVWPEQWYLELARSVLPLLQQNADWKTQFSGDSNTLVNIEYSWKTVIVINSCLAVEAFCNNRLHRIWKLGDSVAEGRKFISIFGAVTDFEDLYKRHERRDKIIELKERVKTLCEIFDIGYIEESNAPLWNQFTRLVHNGRHFLIHPFPDQKKLDECLNSLRHDKCIQYPKISSDIIKYLYENRNRKVPDWLEKNILFNISSIEYLGGSVPVQKV